MAYEVVRELETMHVGVGVLKVDDYQLLVLVRWQEKRRFALGHHAEDVAVLRLFHGIS